MTRKSSKKKSAIFYDELFGSGGGPVRQGMVSAEGKVVAASGIDGQLRIWVETQGPKHTINMRGPITALKVFGPDMIFAATKDKISCIGVTLPTESMDERYPTEISRPIPGIKKIRTDFKKVLLISDSKLFKWQNEGEPLVVLEYVKGILDARYITIGGKRALITVQSMADSKIYWNILDEQGGKLQDTFDSIIPLKLLDISYTGRLFVTEDLNALKIIGSDCDSVSDMTWKTSLPTRGGTGRFLDMDIMMNGRLVEEPVLFLDGIQSAFFIYGRIDGKVIEITRCQLYDYWGAEKPMVTIFPSAEIFPSGFVLVANTGESGSMIVRLTQSDSGRKLQELPSFAAINIINTEFNHLQDKISEKNHKDDDRNSRRLIGLERLYIG